MNWTTNRSLALIFGIIFTLIGIMGFFVSSSMTVGNLLGFDVDIMHNIIHLLTGLFALWAFFGNWSRLFNRVFGIVYLVVAIAGIIPAFYIGGLLLNLMHVNAADNVLHWVASLVALGVGFLIHDETTSRVSPFA